MILYLSGPMSGLPANNYPAFNRYSDRLAAHGVTHINPVDLAVGKPDPEWADYLAKDLLALIGRTTHVALMPGWERSKGASLEAFVAMALGRPVIDLDAFLDEGLHATVDAADIIEAVVHHFGAHESGLCAACFAGMREAA